MLKTYYLEIGKFFISLINVFYDFLLSNLLPEATNLIW